MKVDIYVTGKSNVFHIYLLNYYMEVNLSTGKYELSFLEFNVIKPSVHQLMTYIHGHIKRRWNNSIVLILNRSL